MILKNIIRDQLIPVKYCSCKDNENFEKGMDEEISFGEGRKGKLCIHIQLTMMMAFAPKVRKIIYL